MKTIPELLDELLEKRIALDEKKQQSQEVAEALKLSDEYYSLLRSLKKQCTTTGWYRATGTWYNGSTQITLTDGSGKPL